MDTHKDEKKQVFAFNYFNPGWTVTITPFIISVDT